MEKIKTHILQSIIFFFENRTVCEIIWKNTEHPVRSQMPIWHMRIACWTPEATSTHSEYVILIAFPMQQCLHESALMLRYITWPVLLLSVRDAHNVLSELPCLTLILLTWTIWRTPTNASKWRMGFNSAFKDLSDIYELLCLFDYVAG